MERIGLRSWYPEIYEMGDLRVVVLAFSSLFHLVEKGFQGGGLFGGGVEGWSLGIEPHVRR